MVPRRLIGVDGERRGRRQRGQGGEANGENKRQARVRKGTPGEHILVKNHNGNPAA